MRNLVSQLSSNLIRRKSLQILLLVAIVSLGTFTALTYQNFLYLQAQNISQLSVYNEIIKPLVGLVFVFQLLMISLTASQLIPYFRAQGQQGLIFHSALSSNKVTGSLLLTIALFGFIPVAYFLLIALFYFLITAIDINLILTSLIALIAGLLLMTCAALSTSAMFRKSILALLMSVFSLAILFLIDEFIRTNTSINSFGIFLDLFIQLREGHIFFFSLINWVLWLLFFCLTSALMVKKSRLQSTKKVGAAIVSVFIVIFLNALLVPASRIAPIDITKNKLNSLLQSDAELLSSLNQKITITAVIDDVKQHDEIKQAMNVLKQYHQDIQLNFSNRQALGKNSELVDQFVSVEIAGQKQNIRYPFDRPSREALSQMIIQLITRSGQWITFIEGHGEASPFENSNRALSSYYQSLKSLGWPVAMQNLSKQPLISKNTQVLVIAASQKEWLNSEIDAVLDYLNQGGNLLLLRESDDRIPNEISRLAGVKPLRGTLIDWQGYQSGTPHPAILIVNEFTQHPINTGIDSLLAFPWSQALEIRQQGNSEFEYQSVLNSHIGVWTEFNDQQTELAYNPEEGELRQAFTLAFGIKNKTSQQRIVVVGDASFLSDSAINNYSNRQFALNLISWLSSQDIVQSEAKNSDNYIQMSPIIRFVLLWFFSLILPLIIALLLMSIRFKWKKTSDEVL